MTQAEADILQFLIDYGLEIFSKNDLNIDHLSTSQVNYALHSLVNKKQLIQLEKGKYCVYGSANPHVIASFIAHQGCISYWTAMNYYNLTEQIPNVIFVQTDRQKSNKKILGVKYNFVWLKKEKIFGFKTEGHGNHSFRIASLEKTIIDCFDLPRYSGGYPEIIKAFYNADLNSPRLIRYCKRFNHIALIKRLAYLAELFEKNNLSDFMDFAQKIKNEKYNLFEHNGEKKGKLNKKWGLIMNLSDDEIINMATI